MSLLLIVKILAADHATSGFHPTCVDTVVSGRSGDGGEKYFVCRARNEEFGESETSGYFLNLVGFGEFLS